MKTPNEKVAENLRNAAAVIERDGWCQGDLVSTEGHVCAMGAIGRSLNVIDETSSGWNIDQHAVVRQEFVDTRDALITHLEAQGVVDGWNVPRWNDSHTTSQEDVVKAFLGAADRVEFDG